MKRIATSRSRSARTIAKRRSTSGSESAAVGSSMISTFALSDSAFAISTTCWSAIDKPRTSRSARRFTPSVASNASTSRFISS